MRDGEGMPRALGYTDLREEVSRYLLFSHKPTYPRNALCSSPQTLISGGGGGSFLLPLEEQSMAQEQSVSWL